MSGSVQSMFPGILGAVPLDLLSANHKV